MGWGTSWDAISDPVVSDILINEGGITNVPWDTPITPIVLDYTISSRENRSIDVGADHTRNNDSESGDLMQDLLASDISGVIVVSALSDVFPSSGAVWVEGERIEYLTKVQINATTWNLGSITRGTNDTGIVDHASMVPTVSNPLILVPNKVWVENNNYLPSGANDSVWQASNMSPDLTTEQSINAFTSVTAVPLGGIWYSETSESEFLKDGQGKSIP